MIRPPGDAIQRSETVDAAAATILAILRPLSENDRMNALALACKVFCETDGTLDPRKARR